MWHYNCNYFYQCPYMYQMAWFNQFLYPIDMNLAQHNIYERTYQNFASPMNLVRPSKNDPCSPSKPNPKSPEEVERIARSCENKQVCVWMVYEEVYRGTIYEYYDKGIKISCDDGANRTIEYKYIDAIECKAGTETSEKPNDWDEGSHGWNQGTHGWDEGQPDGGGCPPSVTHPPVGGEEYPGDDEGYTYNDDYRIKEDLRFKESYCPYFRECLNRQEEYEIIEDTENINIPPGSFADVSYSSVQRVVRHCSSLDPKFRLRVYLEGEREPIVLRNVRAGRIDLYGINVVTGNDEVIDYKDIRRVQCLRRRYRSNEPNEYYYEECDCGAK